MGWILSTQRRKGARAQRGGRVSENEISWAIVDAAIEVHRTLGGPGLLESVYEEALVYELELRGLKVERQKAVPIVYKSKRLASDLKLALVVNFGTRLVKDGISGVANGL